MRPLRTAMTGTAALAAVVLVVLAASVPPPPRALAPAEKAPAGPVASGCFHVHTTRSDGTGTVAEVAAAAARAGLRFLILTDHGDATRRPDPPAYRSGVLCIDAVEISTDGGHYAAVGLPSAPYPLGGDPRDVVEDVARLGGFGIVTHPDSTKPELAWSAWDQPFDAVEWLNADSEWRDERSLRLATALLTYPFRRPETIAALFDRPLTLRRWDDASKRRRVIAVAGADAHARTPWHGEGEEHEGRLPLRVPSYEASFRAFSLHVALEQPLSGRAAEDARAIVAALRAGHVHTLIDAFARPGTFEFTAACGDKTARPGDVVAAAGEVVVMRVRSNGPPGSRLVLFRNGGEVSRATARELVYATNRPGAYRAEAWLPGRDDPPMPWAVGNPIFVGHPYATPTAAPAALPTRILASIPTDGEGWHVEHDPQSTGSLDAGPAAAAFVYRIGRGQGRSQFAAFARDGRIPESAGLAFRGVSAGPMRVSVQVRATRGQEAERWARSVYLDSTPREVLVRFAEMRPAGPTRSPNPRLSDVGSLLFVVDRSHAFAGSAGEFRVSELRVVGGGS